MVVRSSGKVTLRDVATLQHEPGFNLRELVLTRLIDKILKVVTAGRSAVGPSFQFGIQEDSYGIYRRRGGAGVAYPLRVQYRGNVIRSHLLVRLGAPSLYYISHLSHFVSQQESPLVISKQGKLH